MNSLQGDGCQDNGDKLCETHKTLRICHINSLHLFSAHPFLQATLTFHTNLPQSDDGDERILLIIILIAFASFPSSEELPWCLPSPLCLHSKSER